MYQPGLSGNVAGRVRPKTCGVGGYAEFLKALHNPKHADHQRFRDWARRGWRDFDPEAFNGEGANKGLGARVIVLVEIDRQLRAWRRTASLFEPTRNRQTREQSRRR